MTELNLLLEEFPDEAGSRTIQALREQLEKELAAQEAKRLQKHSNPAGVAPNGHPSDPRMKTAAEASPGAQSFVCPSHAPCRSFRGAPLLPTVSCCCVGRFLCHAFCQFALDLSFFPSYRFSQNANLDFMYCIIRCYEFGCCSICACTATCNHSLTSRVSFCCCSVLEESAARLRARRHA